MEGLQAEVGKKIPQTDSPFHSMSIQVNERASLAATTINKLNK